MQFSGNATDKIPSVSWHMTHTCPLGLGYWHQVPIKPPVHVLFTHNCNSWISQSHGWSEDWARRGRFSPIVKHERLHSSSRCVLCAAVRLNMDHCHCIAPLSPALRPGQSLRWAVMSVTSDRGFAPLAASWWVPSLNYLLPEAINVIYPSCLLLIRIVSFDTYLFYRPG